MENKPHLSLDEILKAVLPPAAYQSYKNQKITLEAALLIGLIRKIFHVEELLEKMVPELDEVDEEDDNNEDSEELTS